MNKKTYDEMAREADEVKDTERELEGLTPVRNRSTAKEARAVFAVRLSQSEMEIIQAGAGDAGRSIGDFIRAAALAAAQSKVNQGAEKRAATVAEVRDKIRELEAAAKRL
jgi:uncharacterized protein (DUF1778 family)